MRLINADKLCEYALNQKDKSVTPNDIMRFPTVDAIPVEFLNKIINENKDLSFNHPNDMVGELAEETVDVLTGVIWKWRSEND